MTDPITAFKGEYRWLSNMYRVQVWYEDMSYPSVENAYQAAKTTRRERGYFTTCLPGQAKKAGQVVAMEGGWATWADKRLRVMEACLRQKFSQQPFMDLLRATHPRELVEGNDWGDDFWGVCNGVGDNHLGKLLMKIREDIL